MYKYISVYQFECIKILEEVMLLNAEQEIPLKWASEQDKDPKLSNVFNAPNKRFEGMEWQLVP